MLSDEKNRPEYAYNDFHRRKETNILSKSDLPIPIQTKVTTSYT